MNQYSKARCVLFVDVCLCVQEGEAGAEEMFGEEDADADAAAVGDVAGMDEDGVGDEDGEATMAEDGLGTVAAGSAEAGADDEIEGGDELGDELIAEQDAGMEEEEEGGDALVEEA